MAWEDAQIHATDWLLTGLSAGIDRAVTFVARTLIDRTIMPPPGALDALRTSASFYQQRSFKDEPRRFFAFLDRSEPVPTVVTLRRKPAPMGGDRLSLAFPSPYRPANPAYEPYYDERLENHTVHAEMWRHRPGLSRGTVIGLHGFAMGNPRIDAMALMAPALFAAGFNVVLLTLPLHGARSPAHARFSGQLLAAPSVPDLNESIAQTVHDSSALIAWLREQTDGPIGMLGLSLGGYISALMAGLRSDLAFVITIVAPVCLGDLAHRFMIDSGQYRGQSEAALSREEFQAAYRVHSPLTYQPLVSRERLLIVAGRGDRVVHPEHATWLGRHWDYPPIAWFSGSHIAPFGRARVQQRICEFLDGVTYAHTRAQAGGVNVHHDRARDMPAGRMRLSS